ncbi:anaerobic ribonucleoside triphosphate reductase [Haploplasma modicum]|nr:anaerobic ribonucleoside triphosphate reductase [Haploplasma modicum]MCR1808911.1 anaerobic ribonucleoside triphosphate reductase [Haploplasma modicum]
MFIKKRDGREVDFDVLKIKRAIEKAIISVNGDKSQVNAVSKEVIKITNERFKKDVPSVEDIQDIVEEVLIKNNQAEVAKAYILYRTERSRIRDQKSRIMKTFHDITFTKSDESDLKRENANINSDTPMGAMLKYGSEGAKEFNKTFVLDPKFTKAHEEGDIHIHDLDFLTMTMTCCQIDLDKLFTGGFQTGHGSVREPNDIRTYAALACIAIQSNQNDQHGGQSIPKFDYDLAKGVIKTYKKRYYNNLRDILAYEGIELDVDLIKDNAEELGIIPRLYNDDIEKVVKKYVDNDKILAFVKDKTTKETIKDTNQAMESLIHNLNTMHSRAGAQVPFSSINYGTDTSAEGRLITEQVLLATLRGMGENETPIFPIQIFKVKKGVNLDETDPNYDLFKLALKVSAKRLFPNFSFIDATFNKAYYKENDPKTEIAYMGCRTRVMANVHDPENEVVTGRGNLSFTSINLPRIALNNKDINDFYAELDKKMDLVKEQLLERLEIQKNFHVYNFPFLMGQGVWIDSDKLTINDKVSEVIKHGTLTIGFIGLAETLKVLLGYHHGESEIAQKLGLEIISFMRNKTDQMAEEYKLNFSLIATPAEGLSGRFVKMDRTRYGSIEGVTNHEFYTNSFHVPVYYPISAFKKIDIEAPYHELTNGGHISYIELDGDASKNVAALESVVKYMASKNVGYGSINHAVDHDPVCGFVGIINEECPKCGRVEDDIKFNRIRRITGYLVGTLDRFNNAKRKEVEERVKHIK